MVLTALFLKLFNHNISESSFNGALPLADGKFKGKNGDFLDIEFNKPTKINALTLFEDGENVTDFEIHIKENNGFKMIYKQNRISDFRLCALNDVVTDAIRVKICNTRRGKFKNISAYAYNIPKKERSFRRTAYIVCDSFEKVDINNLKHYNKFNLIGCISTNENNEVTTNKEKFEGSLKMVRDYDENADIVATVFPKDNINFFSDGEMPKKVKRFIDEYNLDGVSFDWEYPKNRKEWKIFESGIISLKKEIGNKSITLALPSWQRYRFSDEALNCIDIVEVMTYDDMSRDIDGHHSEFFGGGPNAIRHYIKKGFKPEQLDLGLPFYARPVDAAGYWSDYKAEVDKMDRFTNVVHGDFKAIDYKKKPIIVKDRFYNCVQMIEDKTACCIYEDVGGVMCWALASDVPDNHELCLSKAISRTCEKRTK